MAKLHRSTKRLIVRPLKPTDFESWAIAYSNMAAPKNRWDRKNKQSNELTRGNFRKVLLQQRSLRDQDKFYDLGVFQKDSGFLIGAVSVMDVLRGVGQSAYLGYYIFNSYWGQGFGREAVEAMIDIGFRDIKLHRLEAGIEATNRRSVFLARSLGLRREGLKKRAVFLRGQWLDLTIYAITCEDLGMEWKGQTSARLR
jgi:[ribosomal protein S5]-alanine N-acetyltransferase